MKYQINHWIGKVFTAVDDDISFFAASLSFYSVLSIIPMLWVLFFILDYFGVFTDYYVAVNTFLADSLIPVQADMITGYLKDFMGNAKRMGSVGLVYIIITSILFYRSYQYVVNKIFMVPNHSLLHSIATYLVLAVLMPATLGVSFYLSGFIEGVTGLDLISPSSGLTVMSYLMIWMLFFVLFKVSPNMRISIPIAFKISFVVSIVWHGAKWLFVQYMLVNQTYNTLYGSFSALLFLLIWIYLSWLLLLHGLKACYLMHCRQNKY